MWIIVVVTNQGAENSANYDYLWHKKNYLSVTSTFGSKKLSLCNIYAPNNQTNQLEFMQELNDGMIEKTDLSALIVGGD